MKSDLHIHSSHSDGSDTIKQLVEVISNNNLDIVALTDHDTVDGINDFRSQLPQEIKFIPAVELTCKANDIKCHLLGYNIDPENSKLKSLIIKGKGLRRQKLETRIKYLKDVWKIELTEEELNWLYTRTTVVKTHFANILVKRGLAKDNLSAMKKYLDGCKTGNTRFDGLEAISVIKEAGGIVIWAHPLGGEGETHLSKEEFIPKLKKMISYGIQGIECYYSRYNMEEIKFLVKIAKENNILISGGSDYHGRNKDIPIGRLNCENIFIDSEKLSILEGCFNYFNC